MSSEAWQHIVACQAARAVGKRCDAAHIVRSVGADIGVIGRCRAVVIQGFTVHTADHNLAASQAGGVVIRFSRADRNRRLTNRQGACRKRDVVVVGIGVAACDAIGIGRSIGARYACAIPRHRRCHVVRVRPQQAGGREPTDRLSQTTIRRCQAVCRQRDEPGVGVNRCAVVTRVSRQARQHVVTRHASR